MRDSLTNRRRARPHKSRATIPKAAAAKKRITGNGRKRRGRVLSEVMAFAWPGGPGGRFRMFPEKNIFLCPCREIRDCSGARGAALREGGLVEKGRGSIEKRFRARVRRTCVLPGRGGVVRALHA